MRFTQWYALLVLQKRIPQDVSVISWITQNLMRYFYPPLTGVMQDFPQIASHAVRLLNGQINGANIPADINVPVIFIDGNSVAQAMKKSSAGNTPGTSE